MTYTNHESSPLLFYTHDCIPIYFSHSIFKFADNTPTTELVTGEGESTYRDEIKTKQKKQTKRLSGSRSLYNMTLNTTKTIISSGQQVEIRH